MLGLSLLSAYGGCVVLFYSAVYLQISVRRMVQKGNMMAQTRLLLSIALGLCDLPDFFGGALDEAPFLCPIPLHDFPITGAAFSSIKVGTLNSWH